uniref:CCHC-type domain-containing protein n=1 Tax=Lygus hesperus TaxID=30085 RepID=A0A146LXY5_LYGHE
MDWYVDQQPSEEESGNEDGGYHLASPRPPSPSPPTTAPPSPSCSTPTSAFTYNPAELLQSLAGPMTSMVSEIVSKILPSTSQQPPVIQVTVPQPIVFPPFKPPRADPQLWLLAARAIAAQHPTATMNDFLPPLTTALQTEAASLWLANINPASLSVPEFFKQFDQRFGAVQTPIYKMFRAAISTDGNHERFLETHGPGFRALCHSLPPDELCNTMLTALMATRDKKLQKWALGRPTIVEEELVRQLKNMRLTAKTDVAAAPRQTSSNRQQLPKRPYPGPPSTLPPPPKRPSPANENAGRTQNPNSQAQCFHCNKMGHIAKHCYRNPRRRPSPRRFNAPHTSAGGRRPPSGHQMSTPAQQRPGGPPEKRVRHLAQSPLETPKPPIPRQQ